jgi:hypothetical protein
MIRRYESPVTTADKLLEKFIWGQVEKIMENDYKPIPNLQLSEFIERLTDEEERFRLTWEDGMGRGWGSSRERVAKLWLDEGKGVLCCRFPYHQATLEDIRELIPKGKKSWNNDSKIWEFSVEVIDDLLYILQKHFENVVDLTRETPIMVGSQTKDSLLSILDKDDIKAIYRLLAVKYHPDKQGGDGGKMAAINQIFGSRKEG